MLFRSFAALALSGAAALTLAPTASAQSAARQSALTYLQANSARHGLSQADVSNLVVTDETTSRRGGVTHVYVRQQIGDVPVVAGAMTLNIAPDGRVLLASGDLVSGLALRAQRGGASVSAAQAAQILAADRGLAPTEAFTTIESKTLGTPGVYLSDGGISREPVAAALVYAEDESGTIRLAYEVQIAERTAPHVWLGTIDAATGQVLRVVDLVIHDAFDGDDPAAVAVPLVRTADAAPIQTATPAQAPALAPMMPFAQIDDALNGGPAYRVYAYPVISPIYTTPLPPADARTLVAGPANNLASPFGWHDTNGAAGAEYTTTRGNNAWAYTDTNDDDTPDANSSPDGGAGLQFNFPLDLTQAPSTYRPAAVTNLFYWSNLLHDIYYQYGFDAAGGNFQANGYGLGGASTDDAVRAEAQDGSGTNNANFYTPIDGGCGALGCLPRMQMYIGSNPTPDVDGDLDNHVIAHEYTHGLSKRLTGGPTNECLQNGEQMGEGWSDWYGNMVTMDATDTGAEARGVGNYLFGQAATATGIRLAPYSTNFSVNNYTYGRTRTMSAVHQIGFVWATILWEVTWEMMGEYGFSADLYNADGTAGNQIMLNLVTEGLKMQPCSPGFVDGRNAILAADEALYNGAHTDLLWRAFARRGLGFAATQGSSSTTSDNVESFIEPEQIAPAAVTNLAAIPNGDYVTLTFTATGDDGNVGTATTYNVRRSSTPITTDAEFAAATAVPVTATPSVAGTAESVRVEGLAFNTTYYFAIKVSDESFNTSPLSNSAQATTLAAPTATVPAAPISVTTSGTATATLSLTNGGPSDLRYSLALDETTSRPPSATAPTGTPTPAVERDKDVEVEPGEAQRFNEGGPDAFGYRWIDSNEPGGPTYSFTDISTTGTAVTLGDDAQSTVALPFAFPFYGADQNNVSIVSNGFLQFGGTSTTYTNTAIPNTSTPNHIIAGFWDDLAPNNGGSVRYQNMGDGRFIVQWTNVPRYTSGTGSVTFQIVLFQSGAIEVRYQSVPTTLNSVSVGIENATGTDGLGVVFDAAYVQANLAIRFSALWVEASSTSGLIPAGQIEDIDLLFDATGLAPGTYTANLTVTTNSTNAPVTVIPVTLNVGTTADEGTDALSFEGTHLLGQVYPNPVASAARVDLAVAEAQTVRAELYDALGRRVAVVFDGTMPARTNVPVQVSSGSLATGTYVLRIVGETFQDARRLTVVR